MADMLPVFRFAPSPTGLIHIGNARTALWNALLARKAGGVFQLRLDDTDTERSKPEFAEAILEDLRGLGIPPDRINRQSDRLPQYRAVMDRLVAQGRVYPAFETAEELDRKRKRQQARGLPPVYDRAALRLTDDEKNALRAEGRQPHWRFKLSGQTVGWQDGVRGTCHVDTASLSDPVLVRADGTVLYTLASVVDDIDFLVTDILRGEDHVTNTAVQIEIFEALGGEAPRFHHHNLISAASGEAMSKRTGALSIRSFREAGADPLAVALVATLTGTSEPVRPLGDLDELARLLDPAMFSRAATRFDPDEIFDLSSRLLHAKPVAAVAAALAAFGVPSEVAEAFWLAVRGNLARIEDAREWWGIVTSGDAFVREEPEVLREASRLLPEGEIGPETWGRWIDAIKAATGRKGRALFHPLRLAITGREDGPELKALLPLVGRARLVARLG